MAILWSPISTGAEDVPAEDGDRLKIEDLASELRSIAVDYGPDAAALQALMLVETIRAGALAASEVTVAGPAPGAELSLLSIEVVTGLIFDSDASTAQSRLTVVWTKVALPALLQLRSVLLDPPGLELSLAYQLQRFDDNPGGGADPGGPGQARRHRIRLAASLLEDLVSRRIEGADLLEAAEVGVEEEY
ncbi:MAG: hypothetical protein VCA74_03380 [Deltaproteobacteria bacterium]|jgi:hypothetical protein